MIRVRISKADFEAGFKFRHIGEVLYAKIKSEFDTVVDKCQVRIVVGDEPNAALRKQLAAQNSSLQNSDRSLTWQSSSVDIQVAQVDDQLAKCRVCAPVAGTVLVQYAEAGEFVAPGTPLFRLVETSRAGALFEHLGARGIYVRRFDQAPNRLRFGLPGDEAAWTRLATALAQFPQRRASKRA